MGLSAEVVVLSIVFPLLSMAAVALRLLSRRLKKLRLQADDYIIIPALALVIGMGINGIIGANYGDFGQHQKLAPDGSPTNVHAMVVFNECLLALELMSISALTLIKLSVLLFYRRIFTAPAFRLPVWIVGSIVTAWGIAFFFANLLQCTPISGFWEYNVQRNCVNSKHLVNAYQGLNIMTDVTILVMPWPMIWGLQLPTRRKAQVGGIFLLGAFVCAVPIIRMAFVNVAGITRTSDVTYSLSSVFYWIIVEASVAIVSACLPTMRPLFQGKARKRAVQQMRSGSNDNSPCGTSYLRRPCSNDSSTDFSKLPSDATLENNIVGVNTDDLEQTHGVPMSVIMVRKDFSRHVDHA
ncbi:MAG: hypothetical protein FRX48_04877 [Lasallia pustulata]|uniref:Rhodopsin domain-containing protein n=1 Tax=Lasallia pustulata TaxID=136370 RepID=A0A5M8PRI2_9LECA|nr:MAG: hypothetical protein FRX48_04877 [Lasallia pustulata]